MSKRTVEQVRAELREVQRQITAFGSFACRAEELERILAYFTNLSGKIEPSRLREYFGTNPLACEAANDLIGIQRLLRNQELVAHSQSLTVCLRGLVRGLREREEMLERELAELKPLEPEAVGPWRRLWRSVLRFLDAWPAWWELFAKET